MTTKYAEVYSSLMAPIVGEKSRQGAQGRNLAFVSASQVMNRLDDVLGPENWEDKYEAVPNGVICTLTLTMPDAYQISKQGFGGFAGMDDEGDDFKSGESDALKRAAAKHGVGRYLRGDGVPAFAAGRFEGYHAPAQGQSTSSGGGGGGGQQTNYNCPPNGRALFAWMKDREQEFGVHVLDAINNHPQIKNIFPQRMTEWDQNQVAFGYGVMKSIWQQNGKWPAGAGNSPGEAAAEASPDDLKAIKGKIRAVFEQIMKREQPGIEVKYIPLMARINAAVQPFGFQIGKDGAAEMAAYRNMERLQIALMVGNGILAGAPVGGAAPADDIPF
jgi:hypothetical protein